MTAATNNIITASLTLPTNRNIAALSSLRSKGDLIVLTMDFFHGLETDLVTGRCKDLQSPQYLNLALSM